MATFKDTISLIETIKTALCHNSPIATELQFKKIMDENTFKDFYQSARTELAGAMVTELKSCLTDYELTTDLNIYLWNKACLNSPFYGFENCYAEFIAEILHDAVGYLAYNLDDEQFEDFHGWFDERYSHTFYLDTIEKMLANKPITDNCSVLNEYCEKYGVDINIFYPKYEVVEEIDMSEERDDLDENTRVYSIIKTSVLDDMGVTVVRTTDTTGLGFMEYGFERDECERIAKLDCNDTYNSWDYTGSIIVVRMN
jgi:hypothetical protein